MSGTKDITLTGPKALRGIRNPDLYPQSELNISDDFRKKIQENFARSEYSNYNAAHGHLGYQALNNPALYEVQVNPNLDYGSSVYDEGLTINPDQQDIDNLRFANQSWFTQAFNGIAKGTILAGTTFIDGTLGLVTGIGLSVVNAFSDDKNKHWYEGIWDNPVTKAMNAVNKEMEDVLINYRSEEQTNGPWYSTDNLLSANFIFDTVIKNMGFMIGAAYSGAIYTKGISLAANLLGRMKTAGAAVKTIEAGQKAIQLATATRRTKALIGSFFNAQAEAVTEAYNAKQDFILTENQRLLGRVSELKSQALKEFTDSGGYLNDDGTPDTLTSNPAALAALNSKLNKIDNAAKLALDEIQKRSRSVGTMTGLSNLPILFGSDLLMFGKMYAGGWKSTRNANKTVTRATKEALKDAEAAAKAGDPTKLKKLLEIIARAEETGYQGLSQAERALVEEVAPHTLSKGAGIAWNAIKTPLSEGNEEMMQSAVSQAATYRYQNEVDRIFDSQLDIKATNRVRGYLESIFHGIKSQYGNLDNYEEAFVGAITGILGSPTFGRSNNSTDLTWAGKGKLIGMSGGVFTEIRDYLRGRKDADDAARDATTVLRGGGMPDLIKHLIASSHFDEVMEQAIIHDDEKEYKDARTALAFEMITKLKRAGRLDLLLRAMEVSAEFTDEDINELAEEVSKQVSITTPDIKSKKLQRDALLKLIEDILSDYGTYLQMAMDTGDSSALDTIDEMLTEKRLQVERLDAEIKQAKPVAISPYIKEDGTAFTAEEIKEDINKRISKFQTIINTITLAQDEIDSATSEALTNELLDTLTWYKVMMNDWNERSHKITEKWNLQLEKLANDPDLQTALKSLQLIEDIMEEAGFTPEEAKILLGGRFDELLRVRDYKKLIDWLLKAIQEGGMSFAYLLSSDKKVDTGNGVLETVGDIIFKLLEWVLDKDSSITTDIKEAFRKSLQDLRSIGYGHRRYNLLLDEFLRDPSKIDAAHLESVDKALQEQISQAMQEVIDGIDWNSSDDNLAKYLRDNKDKINLAGGLNSLLSKLDKDKLDKIKKARSLNMGLDALDSLINESDLEDDLKNLLRKVVDDNVDDADDINDLVKKVKDAILDGAVEEELKKNTPNEGPSDALVRKTEAAEIALNKFLDNTLEKLIKATEEALRALDREQEEEERRVKELADKGKDPTEPSDTSGGTRSEDPAKDYTPNTTSDSLARRANKKRKTPQAGAPGYNRRRLISQYYLQGEDKETLPEHYEKHPEDIPDGVDKLAFLKYIKAVHKKLVESGAYTYISGTNPDLKLKEGLEIRFTTDPKLNEEAGVPVILMVTTNELGQDLIIGSLPTSLDFQCKQRGRSSKTVGEAHPKDKKLYEALCKELLSELSTQLSETKIQRVEDEIIKVAEDNTGAHPEVEAALGPNTLAQGSLILIQNKLKLLNEVLSKDQITDLDIAKIDLLLGEIYSALSVRVAAHTRDGMSTLAEKTVSELAQAIAEKLDKLLDGYVERMAAYLLSEYGDRGDKFEIHRDTEDPTKLYIDGEFLWLASNRNLVGEEVLSTEGQDRLKTKKPKVSKITTKVEALMGGYPSLSSLNRSVAEVFGNTQVPITIFLTKGPRSSKAVKNPLDTGGFNPGLVCVYVTTSTGAQIPMMCISTALKDLDDNDWYILEAAKVILKMSDPTLLGSTKDELLRWLPFFDNLHVNIIELNGSRLLVFGWGVNKNGEIAYTYSIKLDLNGNVPLKDAVKFIKAQAKKKIPGKKVYPLANVDRNRLNDEEYMSHITRYIKVNMTSNSPRAIDDWFIYEPTEILKLKRPSGVNPTVTPTGLVPNVELVLTDTGEASISSTGTVTTDSGPELSEAEKDAIRSEPVSGENITTTENGNVTQALNSLFGGSAQTTGEIVIDDIPKRRRRRKLKDGEAEFSLVPQSEPLYTPEMQSIKDKAIADGTFMRAPNDNPTNLTERQWLQVRTKAFKEWFGDWINAAKANMISLGKEIPNTDKYSKYGQKGETDIEIREVLDENGNVIGTVRMEFSGKNRNGVVTLHPQLSVTGKGYGTALYQHIADTYGIPVEESFGEIGKSEAGKALWNKLQRDNNTQISKGDIPLRQLLPTNASKVVDENGEPLVVYHGNRTDNKITTFDPSKKGTEHKERAISGFWFITDKDIAKEEYALKPESRGKGIGYLQYGEVIPVFLNIKNPIETEQQGITVNDTPYGTFTTAEEKLNDFIDRSKALTRENTDGYILTLVDSDNRADDFVSKQTQLVVNNPNQIKSATSNTGEFSSENNDIRLLSTSTTQDQLASTNEIERSLEKVSTMFPKLAKEGRIVLVKGLLNVVDHKGNPKQAYGMFRNGILYISDQSPKGTAFHEAFHYVADTLLTDSEWETMFDEASKLWGNLPEMELEENLAEAFREFMNERQDHSVKGIIKNIFAKLKHIVLSLVGRENYLDSLFWNIYRGKILRDALTIRTHHGTGAFAIDKFSTEFLFTGEGNTAYTSGFYFTSNLTEAEMYRIRAISGRIKNYVPLILAMFSQDAGVSINDIVDALNTYSATLKFGKELSEKDNLFFLRLAAFFTRDTKSLLDFMDIVSRLTTLINNLEMASYNYRKIKEERGILGVIKRLVTNTSKLLKRVKDAERALTQGVISKGEVIENKEIKEIRKIAEQISLKYAEFVLLNKDTTLFFDNLDDAIAIADKALKSVHGGRVYDISINLEGEYLSLDSTPDTKTLGILNVIKSKLKNLDYSRVFKHMWVTNNLSDIMKLYGGIRDLIYSLRTQEENSKIIEELWNSAETTMDKIRILEALYAGTYEEGSSGLNVGRALAEVTKLLIQEGGYIGATHHSDFSGATHTILYTADGITLKESPVRSASLSEENFELNLLEYKDKKLSYDNLDLATKEYLNARGFTKEAYEKLSIRNRELLLQCM